MKFIKASNRQLSFDGDTQTALHLVESLQNAYLEQNIEMPKLLNDFVFNIEVALQEAKVLDLDFNVIEDKPQEKKVIYIKVDKHYGGFVFYPVCDKAISFASIAKTKTLSYQTIKNIKELGYELISEDFRDEVKSI